MTSTADISKGYQKKSLHEHILELPDTYVGSNQKVCENLYIFDEKSQKIKKKNITWVPALMKIFDEALVNAADQITRTIGKEHKVSKINVSIDQKTGRIEVFNDGPGIPVIKHDTEKMYIPEMVFGHLFTSSNYNKNEKRMTGGKNGVGIKLTAIYSTQFDVETCDGFKKFKMSMTNNMYTKGKPKITKCTTKGSYTKVSFIPDYKRFGGLTGLTDDILGLLKRRVYDIAASASKHNVSVYYNNKKISMKSFENYIKLHFDEKVSIVYETFNDRWRVGAVFNSSDDTFEQVSLVNYINTYQAGTHVNYAANKLIKSVSNMLEKKKKIKAKSSHIKNKIIIFIDCMVENPSFNSQSKEALTTAAKSFGSKFEFSDKFINKFLKTGILEYVCSFTKFKESKELTKTNDKKRKTINIPKLKDAIFAGSAKSNLCRLILTEGDSALTSVESGLTKESMKYYGRFPLKGKIINVISASDKIVAANTELLNIKKILNLEHGKVYNNMEDMKTLRYGSIIILTDQDVDGSHIKGLIMNWIHKFWPSLLERKFINSLATPIIRVNKGKGKSRRSISFFTQEEFKIWKSKNSLKGWTVKYYKGLGTSDKQESKENYADIHKKLITYITDKDTTKSLLLAFNKEQADDRKKWLSKYDSKNIIRQDEKNVSYTKFINNDLIHFSQYDNHRSIPSVIDGLKPTQRKIIFASLLRNSTSKKDIKVSQFAGYVSLKTDYHHGEMSLVETITNMAQNHTGSNNINLLDPIGSFGSRLKGGKDSSSARYISTNINELALKIFNRYDNKILDYLKPEGGSKDERIEPFWYMPVVPMILINGTKGIGTGYSTDVLPYNVKDIIRAIKCKMSGKTYGELLPFYRGFKGTFTKVNSKSYEAHGVFEVNEKKRQIRITELPPCVWTDKYVEGLKLCLTEGSKKIRGKFIKEIINLSNDSTIDITLKFDVENFNKVRRDVHKALKLTKKFSANNMHLFDKNKSIQHYKNVDEILDYFYDCRLEYYGKRKNYIVKQLEREVKLLKAQAYFIKLINENKIKVLKVKKTELEKQLVGYKFDKINDSYNYLTNMPIRNLTDEKAQQLMNIYLEKESILTGIKKTTAKGMWSKDLDVILKLSMETDKQLDELN